MTTSTTVNQPNNRTSRIPSSRDFEIFRLSEIMGLTHAEIALTSVQLTRRRISQIVARVRRWLSLHPCQDPRLASELQRKQLARHTERMHLEHVITKARDELIYGKKELTTTHTKDDGTKTTTTREQPFNVQVLKTYLRSVQALAKLQQQPDVNIPTPEECQFPWLEGAINEVYDQWSDKIWSGKLKPQGICELIDEIVAAVLKAAATQKLAWGQESGVEGQPAVGRVESSPEDETNQNSQARSASEGNVPSNSPPPNATAPSISTEYSVPSTTCATAATENANPNSKTQNPKSASHASLTSLREAPDSEHSITSTDAVTSSGLDTFTSSPPTEIGLGTTSPSPENPKREVPPAHPPAPSPGPAGADRIEPWVPTHG